MPRYAICLLALLASKQQSRKNGHSTPKKNPSRERDPRFGPVDAVSLAMRLIVCHQVGVRHISGLKVLLSIQEPDDGWWMVDGGWEMGTLYQYYSKRLWLGTEVFLLHSRLMPFVAISLS